MTVLLDVMYAERLDRQRRVIAAARHTCDVCGRSTRRRSDYFFGVHDRGFLVRFGGDESERLPRPDWFRICSEACQRRLYRWVNGERVATPRIMGQRTVLRVLETG